jgi:hypothetical protein
MTGSVETTGILPAEDGGTFTFGGIGYYDGWLARLNPQGRAAWVASMGQPFASTLPLSIGIGRCNSLYLGATFTTAMSVTMPDGGVRVFEAGAPYGPPTFELLLARFAR